MAPPPHDCLGVRLQSGTAVEGDDLVIESPLDRQPPCFPYSCLANGGAQSTGQFSTIVLFSIGWPLARQSASERNVFAS